MHWNNLSNNCVTTVECVWGEGGEGRQEGEGSAGM